MFKLCSKFFINFFKNFKNAKITTKLFKNCHLFFKKLPKNHQSPSHNFVAIRVSESPIWPG